MFKLTNKQENATVIGYALLWALIGFVTLFFMSQAILTAVYGEIPDSYYQTVLITENASNFTEGMMIDEYIQSVKVQICQTIPNNQTAVTECLNI